MATSDAAAPPWPQPSVATGLDSAYDGATALQAKEGAARRRRRDSMKHREFYASLIRLHILQHAAQEPIFGIGIMEELGRHGYKLSAGTLYPVLHGLEEKGYLRSRAQRVGRSSRRIYRATPAGKKALAAAKVKVRELFGELFEEG